MLLKDFVKLLETHGDNWEMRFERPSYECEYGYPEDELVFTRGSFLGTNRTTDWWNNPIEIPVFEEKAVVHCTLDDTESIFVDFYRGIRDDTDTDSASYEFLGSLES